MREFYTIFAAIFSALPLLSFAADREVSHEANSLTISRQLNDSPAVARNASKAPARIVEEGWHSIGKGIWHEGLLTIFDEIESGLSWEIEIEESDALAGYYRMIPYCADSPVAKIIGAPDNQYLYVDASDPEKVYCEDFVAYKEFEYNYWLSQIVFENGFSENIYGTLEDNVIYFPVKSFAWYASEIGMFLPINEDGDFKIVLPGGEDRPNWNVLGEAEFTDGFCGPYFMGGAITTTVTVEERDRRPGYFRLQGAFSQFGSSNPLIIDATNPDFVVLPYQETGFEHPVRGSVVVYSHCENFISPTKCPTVEDYMATYPEFVATYRDGVISFPPDACVLHFPDWDPWIYSTNDEAARESRIVIPAGAGVGNIISGESDAPAIYYDIYGRQVNNPATGLYIRRCGNKTDKVVIH